jgi:small conductance mechanosensitive channel
MYWKSIKRLVFRKSFVALSTALLLTGAVGLCAEDELNTANSDRSSSGKDPDIPVEVLRLQIKYLSAEELTTESDRWMDILRQTVRELNEANIEIWYANQKLAAAEAAATEPPPAEQNSADRKVEQESERKDKVLARLAELRERRIQIIDRINVVLADLSAKLGMTPEGKEQEIVQQHRRYVNAVKALKLDVADTRSTRATIIAWLKSSEGGVRLAKHIGQFLAIVTGFWLLSIVLGKIVGKAMTLSTSSSQLLRKFVVVSVRRITIIMGLLLGFAALEFNVTPVVAVIGAAGFVIAFALQNTLSNFASGLMIMFYKPFDIGDFVETTQVAGKVRSMTLVTTNVMTADNKLMVVPNNELWGKVITNVTHSSERRVDLVFGIGYDDDIELAERVLAEVVAAHPLVLKEPEPVIRVAELADSSVNLICRPWVKTPDYWTVHGELTRAVKERFDTEGISIPFPQRDIHIHTPAHSEPEK